jgi:excinuclease ABC subunit C
VEHSVLRNTYMAEKPLLEELVNQLPGKPGVYQFLNANGEILYIGKAKNLHKRVASYFKTPDSRHYKQDVLVRKIVDIRYILVENESEALLLENNLIKEYQPRYNILLKDDKTFPWICIKRERFPRVMQTRNYISDGSEYFGPYTSGLMVKTMLGLIRQLYKLRTCKLTLSTSAIANGKFRRCLEFHLGNCKGPCEGLQTEAEYDESISEIKDILKGNYHQVIFHLKKLMSRFAKEMRFEEAEVLRQKIEILEKFKGKSTIVNPKISNVDVFSMVDEDQFAFINFLKIVNGAIVQAHNVEILKFLKENREDILGYTIYQLRDRFNSTSKEIIVPFKPDLNLAGVRFTVPKQGDKKKLLELSNRNVTSFRNDKISLREADKWTEQEEALLTKLQKDLRLTKVPYWIECFDNSNLQGTNPVASCVVFKSARPFRQAYRHFNIKSVEGPNDYASMEEIVIRRYKRQLEEEAILPDLIVIDGGKGQLAAAVKSLKKLELYDKIAIISIAKRLEEIYVPEDPIPLYLDKNSTSLRLIQRIRDEAHRFGITFHKKKRSGSLLESAFGKIPGIGEATITKLLMAEPDLQAVKNMPYDALLTLVGSRAAGKIREYFLREGGKSS